MTLVQADLSRTLHLVKCQEDHGAAFRALRRSGTWSDHENDQQEKSTTLSEVVHHRMREFYHRPALYAAFLSDLMSSVCGVSVFISKKKTGRE
jgi:hypothetical protein